MILEVFNDIYKKGIFFSFIDFFFKLNWNRGSLGTDSCTWNFGKHMFDDRNNVYNNCWVEISYLLWLFCKEIGYFCLEVVFPPKSHKRIDRKKGQTRVSFFGSSFRWLINSNEKYVIY